VTFFCAALVCGALVPVIIRFARRHGLFDQITSTRKMHSARVPRLGGIAIVAGFYAPLLALILYPTGLGSLFYADASRAFAFLFGGLAIAALGIFDDIFGAGAVEKFFVQIAVALYMWWAGFRIEDVHLVGGTILPLGLFGALVTVLWIVGVMNALNLIDGLDGLAAGIALACAGTNFLIASLGDQPLMALWMAALGGSLIAFLRFNFNPAKIFMGDGGSLFIGYVLAVSAIRTNQKSSAAVSLLVPIVALALPIADTLLAMLRRGLRGRPMFRGDKEHIHHRLLALGLTHREVVLLLYAVAIVLGGLSLAIGSYAPQIGLSALFVLVAGALLGLWRLGFFHFEETAEMLGLRRRNLELRSVVRTIATSLREAKSVDDVFESIEGLAPALQASTVKLDLAGTFVIHGGGHAANGDSGIAAVPDAVRARFPVEPGFGYIEIEWNDGRLGPERDHEIAAEMLCEALGRALERTLPSSDPAMAPAPVPTATPIQSTGLAIRRRGLRQ
jgi:UDP-GlcNAc:undecaprenyl-phosphate/decaprenyl-phosphate GlcNAc-1-phosphate transferase